jgi:hypothetical protein
MKLEFSRQIFEKYSNIKFYENPFSGSGVVPCGQTDIYRPTHIYTYTYVHTHTYIYIYIYIYIHTHTYVHTHTHVRTYIHIHTHTYTRTHTHVHTYIHTHTLHTYIVLSEGTYSNRRK